jgi:L-lactate dehydrogenase complex protein LldE
MRVSLFIGCYNDTLFPQTGRAVVEVLERLGHEVHFPAGQTCCGQMHVNTGYQQEAVPLLRNFVAAFGGAEAEEARPIVTPSASCAGMVRDFYPRLAQQTGDEMLIDRIAALAGRVHEFSAFLVDVLGVEDVGAYYPHRVTYHPTCHSLRALRVGDAPLRLLRRVRGLELVELDDAGECCGFGGTFAVKNADTSMAMLSDKIGCVLRSRAETCTAVDNSCLMHIGGALHRQRTGVSAIHLAEILAAREAGVGS